MVAEMGQVAARGVPLVGRERQVARVVTAARAAAGGAGGVLLVTGEGGMGKSRLLEESTAGLDPGTLVAWGRCSSRDDAPAYWPWLQVLRCLGRERTAAELTASTRAAGVVARAVPELGDLFGVTAVADEPSQFELLDALVATLLRAAVAGPVVVVLDDLHDADRASLEVLELLLPYLATSRLVVVGAARPTDSGELLASIATRSASLPLEGVDPDGVAALAEAVGTHLAPPEARHLHERTGGNPYFVCEVVSARREGADTALPVGVRGVLGERIAALAPPAARSLAAVAVLDAAADEIAVARVASRDRAEVVGDLALLAGRALVRSDHAVPRIWQVAHGLLREAVLDSCPPHERRTMEAAAAEVLAERHGDDPAWAASIAHHLVAGLPLTDPVEAVARLRVAADHAASRLAHDEAARHLASAAGLLRVEARCDVQLLGVLLALGQALARATGPAAARASYAEAVALARRLDRPTELARAVLGECEAIRRTPGFYMDAPTGVADLDDALRRLDVADTGGASPARVLRAQLLATRALHLSLAGREPVSPDTIDEATTAAEASGDAQARALAAASRRAGLTAGSGPEVRSAATADLAALAADSGDLELVWRAHLFGFVDALTVGDPVAAAAAAAACTDLGAQLREPYLQALSLQWQATLALTQGRITELDAITARLESIVARTGGAAAETLGGHRIYCAGELGGMDPEIVDDLVTQDPTRAVLHALRAWAHLRTGATGVAREVLTGMAAAGLDEVPRDDYWLATMAMVAEVASALGERRTAATVLRLLATVPDQCVLTAGAPMGWPGPLRHYTGLLRLALGDAGAAVADFRHALAVEQRMSARPAGARTRTGLARALLLAGDEHGGAAELRTALQEATALGMTWLVEEQTACAAGHGLDLAPRDPAPAATSSPARALLRRSGDGWEVGFEHRTGHLGSTKGVSYLAQLLACPRREHHVLDLVTCRDAARDVPPGGATLSIRQGSDAGEVLDDAAIAAYRQRLSDLDGALDEATDRNDIDLAARLDHERAALLDQLVAGVGLGGRRRRSGSDVERARVNVTRALRTAIAGVRRVDPVLADHLDASVRTGRTCAYVPDPTSEVCWVLTA